MKFHITYLIHGISYILLHLIGTNMCKIRKIQIQLHYKPLYLNSMITETSHKLTSPHVLDFVYTLVICVVVDGDQKSNEKNSRCYLNQFAVKITIWISIITHIWFSDNVRCFYRYHSKVAWLNCSNLSYLSHRYKLCYFEQNFKTS